MFDPAHRSGPAGVGEGALHVIGESSTGASYITIVADSEGAEYFCLPEDKVCHVWPLSIDDRALGVLEVHGTLTSNLSPADRELVEIVAAQLSFLLAFRSAATAESALNKLEIMNQLGSFLVHRMSHLPTGVIGSIDKFVKQLPKDEEKFRTQALELKQWIVYLGRLADELDAMARGISRADSVEVNDCLKSALNKSNAERLSGISVECNLSDGLPLIGCPKSRLPICSFL